MVVLGMFLAITAAELSGGIFLGGWETAALTALVVSFSVIGMAFAIAIGFGYKELEEWAKREMYEISISGVIIGVLVVFVNILFAISINLAGGNPMDIAHNSLDEMLYETASIFLSIYNYNMCIASMSTLMLGFFIPIPIVPYLTIRIGSYVNPWMGFSALTLGIDTVFNFISAMLAVLLVEQVLLDFFRVVMLKYFLPLGLLMRAFPLTRVAGATIIAVAIGAYIIYPLAIIYSANLYINSRSLVAPGQPCIVLGGVLALPTTIFWDIVGPINMIGAMMQNFVIISAVFLVTLIITLSSIRSLAGVLGGDPDLFGLARLV